MSMKLQPTLVPKIWVISYFEDALSALKNLGICDLMVHF